MVKSTHISFPEDGVELHVSAQDALDHGIKPGEPAVVEVTVRAHTVQEWIAEATEATFETHDEAVESPGGAPAAADHTLIRWRVGV